MAAGIRSQPRADQREYERAYYAKNRERLLAKSKAWFAANAEKRSEYAHANRNRRADLQRLRRYGLTREAYLSMLESQDGLCRICFETMDPPHVDHDHETGRIRGLLCDNCNRGIGHLRESPEVLASALLYLKEV